MRHITAIILTILLASACAWENSTQLQTPQPGAPCGNAGVVCYDTQGSQVVATGMCCYEGSVCGGGFPNVGCPAGSCCYEGTDGVGAAPPRPQFRAGPK